MRHMRIVVPRYGGPEVISAVEEDVPTPRANEALVVYTYNTGKFCPGDLPGWTKRHPNDTYRGIFNGR